MDRFDALLTHIGTNFWSFKFFITSGLIPAILPTNLLGGEFINPIPLNFTCKLGNGSQCSYINDNNETTACTEWTYDTTMFHTTVAMEWDLVCDNAYLQPVFQMIYTIGCIFGCLLGGYVANRFGRKKAIQVGLLFTAIGSVGLALSPDYSLLIFLRFMLGIFTTSIIYPGFMISMEVCTPSLRPIVGVALAIPYATMIMIFSTMAYYIRDWRYLQLTSCSCLVPLIIFTFLIDESPRWLLINGRIETAITVMKNASKTSKNKYDLSDLKAKIHAINNELSSKNVEKDDPWWSLVLSLFTHKDMRKITLIVSIIWFLQGIVYLGIPLNSDAFSSPFLYIGLIGLIGIPAYTSAAPTTKRYGRRRVAGFSLIITGTGVLIAAALDLFFLIEVKVNLAITLISYMFVCISYQVNFLYAPELFPTTLRPYGTAFVNLVAYIGFSLPPLITDYIGGRMSFLPPIVFGCCGLSAGLLVFLLPETNGKPLMETLADVSELIQSKSST